MRANGAETGAPLAGEACGHYVRMSIHGRPMAHDDFK